MLERPASDSREPTYFIAVCRYADSAHNFVMAGSSVYRQNGQSDYRMTHAIGKISVNGSICQVVISESRAMLVVEPVAKTRLRKDGSARTYQIHYQAYQISTSQYQDFSKRLSISHLEKSDIYKVEVRDYHAGSVQPYNKLSKGNTCRHTAINLLKQSGVDDPSISRFYGSHLPATLTVSSGEIKSPVAILPPPLSRSLKKIEPLRYFLLLNLQRRIKNLSRSKIKVSLAVNKIDALRDLYNKLHDVSHLPAEDLLGMIRDWKNTIGPTGVSHAVLMNKRRSRGNGCYCFFSTRLTGSTSLLKKLEEKLSTNIAVSNNPKRPKKH